jgi:Ni,Fe-hydrogenase I small subunit
MTPFYGRLPNVAGFEVGGWVDTVGLSLAGLTAAGVVAHGVAQAVRHRGGRLPSSEDNGLEGK